jgi:hypothetical protein
MRKENKYKARQIFTRRETSQLTTDLSSARREPPKETLMMKTILPKTSGNPLLQKIFLAATLHRVRTPSKRGLNLWHFSGTYLKIQRKRTMAPSV